MDKLQQLREALEQQRKYEAENWPFVDKDNKPTGTGESITYHLVSLYCWSPAQVLSLPSEQRDERLREIWRAFSIAGDLLGRYEDATVALLKDAAFTDTAASYQAMETALQLLTGNILALRTELLAVKVLVAKDQEEDVSEAGA